MHEEVHWFKPENPRETTFIRSARQAELKGGKLLTLEELQSYLRNIRGMKPIYPGEDSWVAVGDGNGARNWV